MGQGSSYQASRPAYAGQSHRGGPSKQSRLDAVKHHARCSKRYVMGNWKSFKTLGETNAFIEGLQRHLSPTAHGKFDGDIVLFPSFLSIPALAAYNAQGPSPFEYGAQSVSAWNEGAHTGEVTAGMIRAVGGKYALIGHSERRQDQNENGPITEEKVRRCLEAGITPVLCIGETLEQRKSMRTDHVLRQQIQDALGALDRPELMNSFVLAYEPVWAIGTGLVPSEEQLLDAAETIRRVLRRLFSDSQRSGINAGDALPLLYGGSVKRGNAGKIMALSCYQGLLVGGASLDPEHLSDIVAAAARELA
ncbi:MAG: triose-phosphate isomerase [Planctomycetota bacterium]|nr:triose-phosphate isomerase [Planctomycetota bacterium]